MHFISLQFVIAFMIMRCLLLLLYCNCVSAVLLAGAIAAFSVFLFLLVLSLLVPVLRWVRVRVRYTTPLYCIQILF